MSLVDSAYGLLLRQGKTIVLRKVALSAYNVSTGAVSQTITDYNFIGVIINFKDKHRDGTLIKAGDKKVVISAKDATQKPTLKDKIVVGTDVYQIVDFQEIEQTGADVIYVMQVRI